jgi:hypothetical protein
LRNEHHPYDAPAALLGLALGVLWGCLAMTGLIVVFLI